MTRIGITLAEILHRPLSSASFELESKEAPFEFRSTRRIPLFTIAASIGAIGFLLALLSWSSLGHVNTGFASGWVISAVGIFPLVFSLNTLMSDARARKLNITNAKNRMVAAHRIVATNLNSLKDGSVKEIRMDYERLLWHIYCLTVGRTVVDQSLQTSIDSFSDKMKLSKKWSALIGGNGRFNAMIEGAEVLISYEEQGIEKQSLRSCLLFFAISYVTLLLGLTATPEMSVLIGAVIAGVFSTAISLILLNGNDNLSPFGTGQNSISRSQIFSAMCEDIKKDDEGE